MGMTFGKEAATRDEPKPGPNEAGRLLRRVVLAHPDEPSREGLSRAIRPTPTRDDSLDPTGALTPPETPA